MNKSKSLETAISKVQDDIVQHKVLVSMIDDKAKELVGLLSDEENLNNFRAVLGDNEHKVDSLVSAVLRRDLLEAKIILDEIAVTIEEGIDNIEKVLGSR